MVKEQQAVVSPYFIGYRHRFWRRYHVHILLDAREYPCSSSLCSNKIGIWIQEYGIPRVAEIRIFFMVRCQNWHHCRLLRCRDESNGNLLLEYCQFVLAGMYEYYLPLATITGFSLSTGFTGVLVVFLSLFVGGTAIKRWGWTTTALLTPLFASVFGIPFFSLMFAYADSMIKMMKLLSSAKVKHEPLDVVKGIPEYGIVLPVYIFGFITVVCSWSFRYSFFQPTKEMAFIPLDEQVRAKAKAAVEGLFKAYGSSYRKSARKSWNVHLFHCAQFDSFV